MAVTARLEAADVRLAVLPKDTRATFSFDFRAARKQIQVCPDKRGLLLLRVQDVPFHYRVCQFGERFSAYWCRRAEAFLLRLLRGISASSPHGA